jgi:hypothetical protein
MVCITAAPAVAAPATPQELARTFADCAGRYSAEAEHLWLTGTADPARTERRRNDFADLTEAIAPDLPGDLAATLLGLRVSAKAAQRHLLETASFATRTSERQRAAALASGFIAACDRLLPAAS